MVAARNSDSNCKNHDERNRGHKDHNLESQTKANARHDANNGQLNYHCTPMLSFKNRKSYYQYI